MPMPSLVPSLSLAVRDDKCREKKLRCVRPAWRWVGRRVVGARITVKLRLDN